MNGSSCRGRAGARRSGPSARAARRSVLGEPVEPATRSPPRVAPARRVLLRRRARAARAYSRKPRIDGRRLAPVVDATVVDEHPAQRGRGTSARVELAVERRVDELGPRPGTRELGVAPVGDLGDRLARGEPRRDGDASRAARRRRARRDAGQRARGGSQSRDAPRHRPGVVEASVPSSTGPRSRPSPRVGLIVEVPQSADGMRSEPAVSCRSPPASSARERGGRPPPSRRRSGRAPTGLPTRSVVPPAANRGQVSEGHHRFALVAPEASQVGVRHLDEQPARRGERLGGDRVEILSPTDRRDAGARPARRSSARSAHGEGFVLVGRAPRP